MPDKPSRFGASRTTTQPQPAAKTPWGAAGRLVETFLAGRNERTCRAYQGDLENFRHFVGSKTVEEAARTLLRRKHGESNALALAYRAHLLQYGLSPATVNRRLAAVRSLVRRARLLGLVPWTLEVTNVKAQPYRDTRGPGRDGFHRLLSALKERSDSRAKRDRALVRLLFDLALRRQEVVSLDVDDVDLQARSITVIGKGRTQKSRLSIPQQTAASIKEWLRVRGPAPGPLFTNFDRARKGRRLTGRSLHRIVCDLGRRTGIRVTPHGLRHAAITEALDLTGGDVRAVQRFSRHRDLRVLNIYDDSREDLGGKVAQLVASGDRTMARRGYQMIRSRRITATQAIAEQAAGV